MLAIPHRIRRLSWRVNAGGRHEAFAACAGLRRLNEAGAWPEIAAAFDTLGPDIETIHLPRLELSIRVSDVDAIGEAVATEIRRWAKGLRPPTRVDPPPVLSGVGALVRYLETGVLPWPLAGQPPEQIREAVASLALDELDL